jgi:hypothetical protein
MGFFSEHAFENNQCPGRHREEVRSLVWGFDFDVVGVIPATVGVETGVR